VRQREDDLEGALSQALRLVGAEDQVRELFDEIWKLLHDDPPRGE